MSKNPPIVIVPPVTPPPALEDPPGIAVGLASAWVPETWPWSMAAAVEAVNERTVMTPSTALMSRAAPRRETATRSRKPPEIKALLLLRVVRNPFPQSDTPPDRRLPELTGVFSGL